MNSKVIMQELLLCLDEKKPVALVTVVSAAGSTPGRVGAKMLVYEDGSTTGTIGGGCLEAAVIHEAKKVTQTGVPQHLNYNLDNDDASGLGMACGGEITVFIDSFISGPELVIVGAGHISQHLARMAKMIDFHVTVIDDREDFANQERFPEADHLIVDNIADVLEKLRISEHTYLAILTRGHKYDQVALEKVACSEAAYIGMIGSRNKIKTVFDNLKDKDLPSSCLEKVHAPIGLDLGGNSPAEIALSIAAELIKIRYQGGPG